MIILFWADDCSVYMMCSQFTSNRMSWIIFKFNYLFYSPWIDWLLVNGKDSLARVSPQLADCAAPGWDLCPARIEILETIRDWDSQTWWAMWALSVQANTIKIQVLCFGSQSTSIYTAFCYYYRKGRERLHTAHSNSIGLCQPRHMTGFPIFSLPDASPRWPDDGAGPISQYESL